MWFQNLSTLEVAAIVRERVRTVVFAAGGTTRWFMLHYLDGWPTDMSYWEGYLRQDGQRFLEIARMFFDHGVPTLFTHAVVPGQLEGRDEAYVHLALTTGMERIAGSPEFLHFYEAYGVRVRFFGNYRQVLAGSQYARTLARFDEIEERTGANSQHLLFWGFNSEDDQVTPVMELAVQFYRDRGRIPSREEAIKLYYGEDVEPVDIFIGFNRPKIACLMPPLLGGGADLYFTVGLSFDFPQAQLRRILYDHLYARKGRHRDYSELSADAFSEMQDFYRLNQGRVIGIGRRYESGGIWHAMPQVCLPSGWDECGSESAFIKDEGGEDGSESEGSESAFRKDRDGSESEGA
jgi:hypothetical protein